MSCGFNVFKKFANWRFDLLANVLETMGDIFYKNPFNNRTVAAKHGRQTRQPNVIVKSICQSAGKRVLKTGFENADKWE